MAKRTTQKNNLQKILTNPYTIVALSLTWMIIWSFGIALGQWFSKLDSSNSITLWISALPFVVGGFGLGYADTILRKDKNIITSTIIGGVACSAISFGVFMALGMLISYH